MTFRRPRIWSSLIIIAFMAHKIEEVIYDTYRVGNYATKMKE